MVVDGDMGTGPLARAIHAADAVASEEGGVREGAQGSSERAAASDEARRGPASRPSDASRALRSDPVSSRPSSGGERHCIVVCDDTPDGVIIRRTLADGGFDVDSVSSTELIDRVVHDAPLALVIDIEPASVTEAVTELRHRELVGSGASGLVGPGRSDPGHMPSEPGGLAEVTAVVAIGTAKRAVELGLSAAGIVSRPVDLGLLLQRVRRLAMLRSRRERLDSSIPGRSPLEAAAGIVAPPLLPRIDLGTVGGAMTSDLAEPPESRPSQERGPLDLAAFPALAGLPEVESILPDLDGGAFIGSGRFSAEIEELLARGADKAKQVPGASGASDDVPPVELGPDLLAALDDLLALEDDAGAVAAVAPSVGRGRTVVPPDSSRAGARAGRPDANIGGSTSVGVELAGPPSDAAAPRTARARDSAIDALVRDAPRSETPPSPRTATEARVPRGGQAQGTLPPLPWASTPRAPSSGTLDARGDASAPGPHRTHVAAAPGPSAAPLAAAVARHGPAPLPDTPSGRWMPPGDPPAPRSFGDAPSTVAEPMRAAYALSAPTAELGASARPAWPTADVGDPALQPVSPVEEARVLDPLHVLGRLVAGRTSGVLVLAAGGGAPAGPPERVRRVVLREGDIATASSEVASEGLLSFLVERGDLSPEVAAVRTGRLPHSGRHAAAALIAHGFLSQDDLWPVLRAHGEWILGRIATDRPALCRLERSPDERLSAEPSVFGGAAGVEVFVETVRRTLEPEEALARLGGPGTLLDQGPGAPLLGEAALSREETELVRQAPGATVGEVLARVGGEFAPVLHALRLLGVVEHRASVAVPVVVAPPADRLDDEAIRAKVAARLALVEEGDYFSLLGVSRLATSYEIKRAYLDLRRFFEPSRLITAGTVDLVGDVTVIAEVLEEAFQILRDAQRRERYRRAIEASPLPR